MGCSLSDRHQPLSSIDPALSSYIQPSLTRPSSTDGQIPNVAPYEMPLIKDGKCNVDRKRVQDECARYMETTLPREGRPFFAASRCSCGIQLPCVLCNDVELFAPPTAFCAASVLIQREFLSLEYEYWITQAAGEDDLIIHTDGSGKNWHWGAAAFYRRGGSFSKWQKWADSGLGVWDKFCPESEPLALEGGLKMALKDEFAGIRRVIIFTDSQTSLDSVAIPAYCASNPTFHRVVDRCRGLIQEISDRGIAVQLNWVKGHNSCHTNNLVDQHAVNHRENLEESTANNPTLQADWRWKKESAQTFQIQIDALKRLEASDEPRTKYGPQKLAKLEERLQEIIKRNKRSEAAKRQKRASRLREDPINLFALVRNMTAEKFHHDKVAPVHLFVSVQDMNAKNAHQTRCRLFVKRRELLAILKIIDGALRNPPVSYSFRDESNWGAMDLANLYRAELSLFELDDMDLEGLDLNQVNLDLVDWDLVDLDLVNLVAFNVGSLNRSELERERCVLLGVLGIFDEELSRIAQRHNWAKG
ncbi:hypothetical protein BT63DRAFT_454673 [Microthyrium microscopicum]|uniref:RNase H type-1 domain-containing protein n=1 Tax=Microthyrium microscopicum TaxID=703497 RepID=A0A6A6UHY3_9PEZI|nr:hypothetical protein BT63DRAFT_454673 [Microthyrium microscopicum]